MISATIVSDNFAKIHHATLLNMYFKQCINRQKYSEAILQRNLFQKRLRNTQNI